MDITKNPILSQDFSTQSIDDKEASEFLVALEEKREEVIGAVARYYFLMFSGKNFEVKYTDGVTKYVVCRGTTFYAYSESSPYVDPEIWTYEEIAEDFGKSNGLGYTKNIASYTFLSNEEIGERIKQLYANRAAKSKALFNKLLVEKN